MAAEPVVVCEEQLSDGVKHWLYVHHSTALVCADSRPTPSAMLGREQVLTTSLIFSEVVEDRGKRRAAATGMYRERARAYRFRVWYPETTHGNGRHDGHA